jgi:site-specific DNA-methyltransferase (adenine-specific)
MFKNIIGTHKPDILDCISNLSSDEVFTPPSVVNQVLDLLPSKLWTDPNIKILDPACKSGVFLREAAKRLMIGLENKIKDEDQRREHIFKNMLYGISITELTGYLARRSLYYSKSANSEHSVVSFDDQQGNIHYSRGQHIYVSGKCKFCGVNEDQLDRGSELENHAYQFLHKEKVFPMKFDVIIGNPPYQLDTGGSGRQARPIYQLFVDKAKKLDPKYISFIIPSRWFAGGMGLDVFRENMLNDKQIRKLTDFIDAGECFPGVDIAGGVCYFLWEKGTSGDCEITSKFNGVETVSQRPLNEFKTFIRHNSAVPILKKINTRSEKSLTTIISGTRPFGLQTKDRPDTKGKLKLFWTGGEGPVEDERVTAGREMIPKWKTITSKTSYDHAGQPDKNGYRRVLSRVEILAPNTVCTESYIVVGCFDSKEEAENLAVFIKTKFVRFMVSLLSFSQDITKDRFTFVPLLSMKKKWTDDDLYRRYELSELEISFIETSIKEMV